MGLDGQTGVEAAQAGFNESYYGFRSFGKLLEEAQARKLLTLEPDEKSGRRDRQKLQHGILRSIRKLMPQYTLPPGHRAASPRAAGCRTALAAVAGTGLLVLAFFFAMFALMAAALLVGVIAVRWWWLVRAARRRTARKTPWSRRVPGHRASNERRPAALAH